VRGPGAWGLTAIWALASCSARSTVDLVFPWPADQTAVVVATNATGDVLTGFPLVVAPSMAAQIELSRNAEIIVYAATFSASIAADFPRCGLGLAGTGTPVAPTASFASDRFRPGEASDIPLHAVPALPFSFRYQTCATPTACSEASVEPWRGSVDSLDDVVAISDDASIVAPTRPAAGVREPAMRYDFAAGQVMSSTSPVIDAYIGLFRALGHVFVVNRGGLAGSVIELGDHLEVLRRRVLPRDPSVFAMGQDGSFLMGLARPCGSWPATVFEGSWSSTSTSVVGCSTQPIGHAAVLSQQWRAYADQDDLVVLSSTAPTAKLTLPSPDYTAIAAGPGQVVGGARTQVFERLLLPGGWTQLPRPFAAVPRVLLVTANGAVIAAGEVGSFAILQGGSWCSLDLGIHVKISGLSIAPSGRTLFLAGGAIDPGTGALVRIHLPAGL
jgi:hypothetical protein